MNKNKGLRGIRIISKNVSSKYNYEAAGIGLVTNLVLPTADKGETGHLSLF
jgi:hypothetical protein